MGSGNSRHPWEDTADLAGAEHAAGAGARIRAVRMRADPVDVPARLVYSRPV
jgi:hypothetical protein